MEQTSTQSGAVTVRLPVGAADFDALPAGTVVLLEGGTWFEKHAGVIPGLPNEFWTLGGTPVDLDSWQLVHAVGSGPFRVVSAEVAS